MRVSSEAGDFLEMDPRPGIECAGDIPLHVRVRYRTFTAEIETWIQQTTWFGFAQDLTILEERRQGEARLESMSPGELAIVVRSIGRAGHVGVEGTVGATTFDSEVSMRFSIFAFEPSQLVVLAREARLLSAAAGSSQRLG